MFFFLIHKVTVIHNLQVVDEMLLLFPAVFCDLRDHNSKGYQIGNKIENTKLWSVLVEPGNKIYCYSAQHAIFIFAKDFFVPNIFVSESNWEQLSCNKNITKLSWLLNRHLRHPSCVTADTGKDFDVLIVIFSEYVPTANTRIL